MTHWEQLLGNLSVCWTWWGWRKTSSPRNQSAESCSTVWRLGHRPEFKVASVDNFFSDRRKFVWGPRTSIPCCVLELGDLYPDIFNLCSLYSFFQLLLCHLLCFPISPLSFIFLKKIASFGAKLRGRYRYFLYNPCPLSSTSSPITTLPLHQSGTSVPMDEPMKTPHPLKPTVCTGIHSACCRV